LRLDWDAAYLDGRTAARRRAIVHITRTGLDITVADAGTRFFWTFKEIRQTQGTYAGEQVRLERGGELSEVLLIGDIGFLAAARAVSPEAGHLHDPARRRFRAGLTFGALVTTIVLALGIYYVGIPAFAQVAAARVPVSWEESLGGAIVQHFAPPSRRCEDPVRQARIDRIVAELTAKARPQPYTFRVTIVNSRTVNAVAAPGGNIILFRGLLERTDNAEELAGVLAHEVEHVLHRHVTRAIFQHASTGVLMAALVGDVSSIVAYGLEGARTLGELQMSRAAESEADRDGIRLLQEAGIDTAGMITFFEKLSAREREHGGGDSVARYLRTHPTTAERIATLRTLAAAGPRAERRLLPEDDWDSVKNLCGELPVSARSPRR
jgi:Zn-dependent protease with chaperone function